MRVFNRAERWHRASRFRQTQWDGFTIVETLFVIGILAILLAIAVPSWITFAESWTLNAAQDTLFQEIQVARGQAERYTTPWQASVRTLAAGTVQVAAHPATTVPERASWQTLDGRIRLLLPETTLDQANGIFRVQFNHRGGIQGQLGKITLVMHGHMKRCVVMATLLGNIRKGVNRPSDSNRCD